MAEEVRIDYGGWISGPMLDLRQVVTAEDATTLFELKRIWGDRYKIAVSDDGTWYASRQGDSLNIITADSGPELRGLISEDYAVWARGARR